MKFYQCDYVSNGKDDFEKRLNLYWDVKDFHWLKNLVKSPNFVTISEEERMEQVTQQGISEMTRGKGVSQETSSVDNDESSDDDEL